MAEVATKKSINVVSSKKSEVCSVQSNNGLIQLDNLTASNKQLISLCDNNDDEDDLILTNNTRNELDTDDKSLQELIESELALRICSSTEEEAGIESDEQQETMNEPETVKRIVLDIHQEEDVLDVNAKFIVAETEHSALVDKSYSYQNGHMSPETKISDSSYEENVKPEPITGFRDEEEEQEGEQEGEQEEEEQAFDEQSEVGSAILVEETTTREIDQLARDTFNDGKFPQNEDDEDPRPNYPVLRPTEATERLSEVTTTNQESFESSYGQDQVTTTVSASYVDKYQQEQEVQGMTFESTETDIAKDAVTMEESRSPKGDAIDTWSKQTVDAEDRQTGQFSDNFDQSLCEGDAESRTTEEFVKETVPESKKLADTFELVDTERDKEREEVKEFSVDEESKVSANEKSSSSMEEKIPEDVEQLSVPGKPIEESEEEARGTPTMQFRSFDDVTLSQSESSADAASTQEFLDTERRVLSEDNCDQYLPEDIQARETLSTEKIDPSIGNLLEEEEEEEEEEEGRIKEEEAKEEANDNTDEQNAITESSSELSVSEPTFIEKTEVVISESSVKIVSETQCLEIDNDAEPVNEEQLRNHELESPARAPLATPDDETSDVSNVGDSESREETITTSASVVTSPGTKVGTKTKKKKIEGVAGNDASPNLTPRTKKTKKSKKNELEKENISVNSNLQEPSMHPGPRQTNPETLDFSDEDDLSNVNVKSLTQNYVSEATRNEQDRCTKEKIATGVSIKQLCRSFGDISNMSDGDQTAYGKTNHAMDTEEKARSLGDLRVCEKGYSKFTKDALVFTGVSVKALRASYCSLANLTSEGKDTDRPKLEKSSFNKFDALSKKTVLHVRSIDAGKVQQQLNAVGQNGDTNPNCRSCGKVVFQMEQTKAEGLVWHKNCFRCVQCSKQLNVDNYESHESTLYCKPHFKELFQPKPVEESDEPVRPRKPELIIRENEPKELPPDVVRASDKPDLGLEELSSLNVKSRFQVFEKAGTETNEIERSPSQIAVKRSPSILSKLAKFQAKGMDIGVADESLNGIPYEESSESEEEEEAEETEELDSEIVKAKRATRERPISFTKMDDIKNRWETTSQQGRREVQREARKEEIAGIRSRLFMGKQGKMKEMYQQAVAGSERVTKINAAEEIQHSTHARSIKERFERGEPIAASDDETDSKPKPEKADEEVIAAGISRKSRSLFLELDATAAKTGRPVTPVNPKTPAEAPRRARDAFMGRQVSDDVVRSSDTTEEVQVETSDISNKFKFFESYKEPEKQRKQFRITPPRDGQVKMDSPEREIYRDPDVVRAEDRVNEVVHTDTARKMLSIFRQMEENACKKELPNGPKPLKRFTPPPEDKYAKPTASDSEEVEDEDGDESEGEDSTEERDPNYVRASDKVEDEFLKQAQNAARAKTLCAKFEHWEETDGKTTSSNQHIAEMEIAQNTTGEQQSIESASSLRARFESLGSQTNESPRTPKVKVNRFVEIQASCTDVCESCEKKVYPLEKVETNNKIFHKQCFRCQQCNCVLRMDTFTLNNGKLYCIPHFKQLFITRGNYDEGFGVDPHKNKWTTSSSNPTSPSPIAVSNGDL